MRNFRAEFDSDTKAPFGGFFGASDRLERMHLILRSKSSGKFRMRNFRAEFDSAQEEPCGSFFCF